MLLLQFHDDVSDEEAVQRLLCDLRWQVALNLPTDFAGFDPSSLTYFRRRLIAHRQERYAFDRFIQVGREAGFIPDRVTVLTHAPAQPCTCFAVGARVRPAPPRSAAAGLRSVPKGGCALGLGCGAAFDGAGEVVGRDEGLWTGAPG